MPGINSWFKKKKTTARKPVKKTRKKKIQKVGEVCEFC